MSQKKDISASVSLKLNGEAMPNVKNVSDIQVISKVPGHPEAEVTMFASLEESTFPAFAFGDKLEIHAGHGEDHQLIFAGEIVRKKMKRPLGDTVKLVLEARGERELPEKSKKDPEMTLRPENVLAFDLDSLGRLAGLENLKFNPLVGDLLINGTANLALRDLVKLENWGNGFDGLLLITGLEQQFHGGNWHTRVHTGAKIPAPEYKKEMKSRPSAMAKAQTEANGDPICFADQYGNLIEFSESGILIQSAKSIHIKADQEVLVSGEFGVDVEARVGDANLKGINANVRADFQASVTGSGGAKVQGGATLELKGAMIMLN